MKSYFLVLVVQQFLFLLMGGASPKNLRGRLNIQFPFSSESEEPCGICFGMSLG